MKIMIVWDDGEVIEEITDVEEYDISKPIAYQALSSQVMEAVEKAQSQTKGGA